MTYRIRRVDTKTSNAFPVGVDFEVTVFNDAGPETLTKRFHMALADARSSEAFISAMNTQFAAQTPNDWPEV
jgi:hypothetical protein